MGVSQNRHNVEVVKTELELTEDLTLQEKGWKLQRIGYVFIFLFVTASAIGLFGDGILSKKQVSGSNSLIEYERFYRRDARMDLKIEINTTGNQPSTVSFPNTYLKSFRIEAIEPEPKGNVISKDRQIYQFSGFDHMNISFRLVPQKVGQLSGMINVNSDVYKLSHFIYP